MKTCDYVSREKFEEAFEQIRKDIALFHKDAAYAAADRTRWLFLVMWIVFADLTKDLFGLGILYSVFFSGIIVYTYRFLDGWRIRNRALRLLKEPLEPMFETKVDLSSSYEDK